MLEAPRWVVVLTHAQAEWQSFTGLLRAGVEAFLPYTLGHARRGRWVQGVVRPTYPGYLFAQLGNTEKIRKVVGVRDLLRAGDLVIVSEDEVERCRAQWREDYRDAEPRVRRKLDLRPGMWVSMPAGPFAGVPVCIDRVDKSGLVSVSIGKLQMTFHAEDAVRVRAKPARNHHQRKPKPL